MGVRTARDLNPALLLDSSALGFDADYSLRDKLDVSTARARVTVGLGRSVAIALSFRQREIQNIFDDPALSELEGLQVGDWAFGMAVANAMFSNRLVVGLSAEHVWSTVFASTGRGWIVDVGAAYRMSGSVTLGASIIRAGYPYVWKDDAGLTSESPLGTHGRVGSLWNIGRFARTEFATFADYRVPLDETRDGGAHFGVEALVARHVALRGGYESTRRAAGGGVHAPSFGVGIHYSGWSLDFSRDHVGSEFGERTLIGASLQR